MINITAEKGIPVYKQYIRMITMSRMVFDPKRIFKKSIFGALFILWTAPIDGPRLDISIAKKPSFIFGNLFLNNLIIGQAGKIDKVIKIVVS